MRGGILRDAAFFVPCTGIRNGLLRLESFAVHHFHDDLPHFLKALRAAFVRRIFDRVPVGREWLVDDVDHANTAT